MCKGLIGKKLGMTSQFTSEGRYVPVTVVQVGPCVVTQVKTIDTDGYNALQLGFGEKTKKNCNKPMQGHLSKSGHENFSVLREVSVDDPESYKPGQTITTEIFGIGERVEVVGISKGRGFSGVMKRHGFSGGKKTHGSHSHRIPGSIGCSAWPAKVIKGKKMPGNYGNEQNTLRNVEIFDIRPDDNLVLLKGPVPGSKAGHVTIQKPKYTK
ncbi:MAG: 50S ribosomal protein L3 [Deltaproteobacteria bacterium]|nr:50S ribosomal protein L3 [Deltaproteobacteria bacterium]